MALLRRSPITGRSPTLQAYARARAAAVAIEEKAAGALRHRPIPLVTPTVLPGMEKAVAAVESARNYLADAAALADRYRVPIDVASVRSPEEVRLEFLGKQLGRLTNETRALNKLLTAQSELAEKQTDILVAVLDEQRFNSKLIIAALGVAIVTVIVSVILGVASLGIT